jgi:PAS domain S-box-containing protein
MSTPIQSLDYCLFTLIASGALIAISIWLRRSGRSDRTLVLVWSFLTVLLLAGWFLVHGAGNHERDRLRKQIEGLAPTYADELEAMEHEKITLDTDPDDRLYLATIEKQIRWLELNQAVSDIYTFRKHPDGNQLIVDSETDYDNNGVYEGDRESRTEIGEVWDERSPFLDRAYEGETAFDDTPYTDRWGTWVSAYVPMHDEAGNVEAVLGVDYPADEWVAAIARARLAMIGFLTVVVTIGLASTSIITILRANIAERRRSESQLRDVAERTRLIIDTAYAAFVAIDRDGIIVDWNPQAEQTFGWKRDDAMGRPIVDTIIPPQFRDAHTEGLQRFLATGEEKVLNQILELSALRTDGSEFPIELTITPMRLGDEYLFHAFLHDITDRKQAEDELLRAKDAAEAATRAKSEFLANMSHEIRTPMNGIIGMSELLANTQLDVQQRDYLGMVRLSANSLLRLLNDILDFSKIEAGKLELETVDFNLRDCVTKSAQTLASRAAEKRLEVACRIDPDLPDRLIGDPGRLGQIVVNLVGNAVKFTDQGEVVVDVRGESIQEGEASLHFSVRDTGVGIPPEKQESIFELFSQADASTTRRFGGTGLGLAISSQLVEMMGGRIRVKSEADSGSTFYFTATFGVPTEAAQKRPASVSQLAEMPILVVDDNETNRRIFEEILKSWNMTPAVASEGFAALAELKRAAEIGQPFRLVLLDCMMPKMDGFQLAKHVRADPQLADCALVMVSSGANPEHAEMCRQYGIIRYMLKPVVQSELLDTILSIAGQPTAEDILSESMADDTEQEFAALDILLVEDGFINQKVASGLLEGHNVVIASDGKEAIESMEKERFDIVLMDVQMPEMDGFEATAAIRRREEEIGRRTPIIAMTASAMKGDRERCLEAGMDSYIAKPLTAEELHRTIKLAYRRDDSTTESGRIPASPGSRDSTDVIDLEVARSQIPGGDEGVTEMAQLLLEQCPTMMTEIEEALQAGDAKRVQRGAHTLKGSADVFGAMRLVDVAQRIEQMGERGELDDARRTIPELEKHVSQLQSALAAITDSRLA